LLLLDSIPEFDHTPWRLKISDQTLGLMASGRPHEDWRILIKPDRRQQFCRLLGVMRHKLKTLEPDLFVFQTHGWMVIARPADQGGGQAILRN
jgi:hypothetical protein